DTGLGLNRLALIQQYLASVFETDQFAPLIALGEELSGRSYGSDFPTDKALRVLADHGRAMTFLVADGVVPSNEERGYVLRRIMRRAIAQGRALGLDPGYLPRYAERVTELMGSSYPELHELIERARDADAEGIAGADAFQLHDTYGFPIDLTLEIVSEHGLGVDEEGFEALMDDQRNRARAGSGRARGDQQLRERATALAGEAGFATEFVGYRATDSETTLGAVAGIDGHLLVKLVQSPFYATGGGQVADAGYVECADGDCRARVDDVLRIGDDQVVALVPERGTFKPGERVHAHVDRANRHATESNHTATHLLHAALRRRLGSHVHQAGSYVGPDKLRFDFTHGGALSAEDLRAVEDEVTGQILGNLPVRALTTTLDEARGLGAMALFGEKYGDVVRMVEVGDGSFSRELCGGTHVHSTAEIGLFKLLGETSSAANVRRIEEITGPAAVALMRERDRALQRAADTLRVPPERTPEAAAQLRERVRELELAARRSATGAGSGDLHQLNP